MSPLVKNILANFAGRGCTVLMSVAFVPIYIRVLGVEVYGLIGALVALQSAAVVLDLGLSTTLNRELARREAVPELVPTMASFVRTLELVYWCIAVLLALTLVALAPLLAEHWFKSDQLDTATLSRATALFGLNLGLQWPLSFYSGGLLGVQRQVAMNGLSIAASTARSVGGALVILYIAPRIEALLLWQAGIGFVYTLASMLLLWRSLPPGQSKPEVDLSYLSEIKNFACGVALVSICAVLLTQTDKLVLSKILSLKALGYYTVAGLAASGLGYLSYPISTAFFPRLSRTAALWNEQELKRNYHLASQCMAVIIASPTAILMFFSKPILLLWTHDPATAANASNLLVLLSAGTMLNTFMQIPYYLQLANNWTGFALRVNIVAVCVLVPLTTVLALRLGATGGALAWVLLNAGYVVLAMQLMHRTLLPGELSSWYVRDIAAPTCSAFVAVILTRLVIDPNWPAAYLVAALVGAGILGWLLAAVAANRVRIFVLGQLRLGLLHVGVARRVR